VLFEEEYYQRALKLKDEINEMMSETKEMLEG